MESCVNALPHLTNVSYSCRQEPLRLLRRVDFLFLPLFDVSPSLCHPISSLAAGSLEAQTEMWRVACVSLHQSDGNGCWTHLFVRLLKSSTGDVMRNTSDRRGRSFFVSQKVSQKVLTFMFCISSDLNLGACERQERDVMCVIQRENDQQGQLHTRNHQECVSFCLFISYFFIPQPRPRPCPRPDILTS